ncbi:TlpA family protein disulfide reductase [Priestia aryabhattai]
MGNFILIGLIIISILVIVEMWFMFKLAKMVVDFLNRFQYSGNGEIVMRNIEVGQKAPVINSKNQHGKTIDLYNSKEYKILLFKDKHCGTCQEISKKLPTISENLKSNARLIVVQKEHPSEEMIPNIDYIIDQEVFNDYLVNSVPNLFIVDGDGNIVKTTNLIGGFEDILDEISSLIKLKVS